MTKLQKLLILLLTVFALTARLHRLEIPVAWVFDEIYHAYTAEFYALNDPRGYEWWHPIPQGLALEWLHPPVEKLLMATSIHIFSHPFEPYSQTNPPLTPDVTFAWRFPTALCTSLTVLIIILMGTRMFNFWVGFLAGLFYAIDPLSITHGRLGTSDGIFTFFSTWAFYRLYIFLLEYPQKYVKNLIWLGVIVGLAFSTKFTGVFNIGWTVILVTLFFVWRHNFTKAKNRRVDYSLDRLFLTLLVFGLTVLNVYLFSYLQWWMQGHTWQQFYELHNQIIRYHIGLKATHPFSSHPLSWPIMQKPVWIYMGRDEFGNELNIWSTGNKWTWYGGLVAVVYFVGLLVTRFYRAIGQGIEPGKRSGNTAHFNLAKTVVTFLSPRNTKILFLLTAYLGMFLPWALSPRIMFIYHYLPALPFLFLLLAKFLFTLVDKFSGFIGKFVKIPICFTRGLNNFFVILVVLFFCQFLC